MPQLPAEAVLRAVAAAEALPGASEFALHALLSPSFADRTAALAARIQALLVKVHAPAAEGEEALALAADAFREAAFISLDDLEGRSSKQIRTAQTSRVVKYAGNLAKPQSFFSKPVDNSRDTPFRPLLTSKPHALVPLPDPLLPVKLSPEIAAHLASLSMQAELPSVYYANPYEVEIMQAQPPDWMYSRAAEFPKPPEDGPMKWVASAADLDEMVAHLSDGSHKAIAVDVEHHSLRSFQGLTCVMQISTTSRDFVIDTLALRESLSRLLPVFADSTIVKVLHGANSDVEWLQRDLGLYLVQLFDTGQAARVLNYSSASFAFALQKHTGIKANKAFQLADWRIRPLSVEMMAYAREDTHWLLFLFDQVRLELVKNGSTDSLNAVIAQSKTIAAKAYIKPRFDARAYLEIPGAGTLNAIQLAALAALDDWRDATAREQDESPAFVMSNACAMRVAKALPATPESLLACLDESALIARSAVSELLRILLAAPQKVAESPEPSESMSPARTPSPEPMPPPSNVAFAVDTTAGACIGINSARVFYDSGLALVSRWTAVENALMRAPVESPAQEKRSEKPSSFAPLVTSSKRPPSEIELSLGRAFLNAASAFAGAPISALEESPVPQLHAPVQPRGHAAKEENSPEETRPSPVAALVRSVAAALDRGGDEEDDERPAAFPQDVLDSIAPKQPPPKRQRDSNPYLNPRSNILRPTRQGPTSQSFGR